MFRNLVDVVNKYIYKTFCNKFINNIIYTSPRHCSCKIIRWSIDFSQYTIKRFCIAINIGLRKNTKSLSKTKKNIDLMVYEG